MTWQQIREAYPAQWVLMEALDAYNEGKRRVFVGLSVLDTCQDGKDVFARYRTLKQQYPNKEILFYHSDRPTIDVDVLNVPGMRWRI